MNETIKNLIESGAFSTSHALFFQFCLDYLKR